MHNIEDLEIRVERLEKTLDKLRIRKVEHGWWKDTVTYSPVLGLAGGINGNKETNEGSKGP